jgi:uncharacterized protein (TIGR02001 family)
MKKSFVKKAGAAVGAVAGSLLLASAALAQAKKPEPEFTVSGNAGLFSDYRFRGFTQTGYKPAFQGGFDFAHKSGFYLGNWNSNVEQGLYNGASLEMDLYGGYKMSAGPVSLDFGAIYYYYPNTGALGTTKIDNGEVYVGAGWGPASAKLYYGVTSFFGLGDPPTAGNFDSKGSWYLDLAGNFDVGSGITLNAHVGVQKVEGGKTAFQQGIVFADEDMIYDYKVGVSYDLSGWALGAAVIGTSEKGFFRTAESGFTKDGGKTSLVVSVSKTF